MKYAFYTLVTLVLLSGCRKEEDNRGLVSFTKTSIEVSEADNKDVGVNVGINRINHDGGTVNITVEGGIYGEDYTTSFDAEETDLAIPAGSISEVISLRPIDNEVEEEDRVFSISLNSVTGDLQLGTRTLLNITATDDDAPVLSAVNFIADTLFVDENISSDLVLTLMIDPEPKEAGMVTFAVEGEALPGEDYDIAGLQDGVFSVDINPGATQSRFTIKIIDNDDVADDKLLKINMSAFTEFLEAGDISEKVIVIINDD